MVFTVRGTPLERWLERGREMTREAITNADAVWTDCTIRAKNIRLGARIGDGTEPLYSAVE